MSTQTPFNRMTSNKIQPTHHERLAVIYVRQSSPQQMLRHQESTRLQYGLVERAHVLGWAKAQVLVIDEDLGKSADSIAGRSGFQRLVTEVSLAHVGLVLGLEMSRLARSNRAWHHLLEVCALFGTPATNTCEASAPGALPPPLANYSDAREPSGSRPLRDSTSRVPLAASPFILRDSDRRLAP